MSAKNRQRIIGGCAARGNDKNYDWLHLSIASPQKGVNTLKLQQNRPGAL